MHKSIMLSFIIFVAAILIVAIITILDYRKTEKKLAAIKTSDAKTKAK